MDDETRARLRRDLEALLLASQRQPDEIDRRDVADEMGISMRQAGTLLERLVAQGKYTKRKIVEGQERWVYRPVEGE